MAKSQITSEFFGKGPVERERIDAVQLTHGKKVWTAGGHPLRSTWYEHPFRTSTGKLRSYEDTLRFARKF